MIIAFFSRSLSLSLSMRPLSVDYYILLIVIKLPPNISITFLSLFSLSFVSTFQQYRESRNWRHDERSPKIDGRRLESRLESRIGSTEREKSEEYRATWQLSTKGRRNRWEWRSRGFHGTTRRTDTRSGSKHTRIANSCSAMFASEFPPPRGGSIVSQGGTTW